MSATDWTPPDLGPYRAVVVELADEVVFVRWLGAADEDPSDDELESLATSYRIAQADSPNAGYPVKARVVAYTWAGPMAYVLSGAQQMALAGLNDDGTIG